MANARNSGGRPVSTAVSHVGIRPTVPNVSRGRWLAAGGLWVYALVLAVWLAAYWRESETARYERLGPWRPGCGRHIATRVATGRRHPRSHHGTGAQTCRIQCQCRVGPKFRTRIDLVSPPWNGCV